MAFDLVAEQVNDRVWFSDLFRYSGKQTHTAARLNQENPYFHVSSTISRPNGKLSDPMRLVTMKPTSVIIMDTHPIIRMSIEVLLQKNSELQIVLKTDDYRITIDYLRTRPVDLIIMDIDLPGTDGFTFLKRIKQIQSTVKVLFLSSKSECFYAGRAIQAGANGFVSKCNDQNDIFHAVQMILSGYTFFPSETLNYIHND